MSADLLTPAVLDYIDHGAYPDSEAVSSTVLSSSTLSSLLHDLKRAQDEAKDSIRSLSKSSAPDIDTWIARAKALQSDILRSRDVAREIVAEHEAGRAIRAEVEDHAKKVALLEKEVLFDENLMTTLEHVRYADGLLERTQAEAVKGDVGKALQGLEDAEASIAGLEGVQGSRAYDVLQQKTAELRGHLVETATEFWNALIRVDMEERAITVQEHGLPAVVAGAVVPEIGLERIVMAVQGLDVLQPLLQKLARDIDRTILRPRMVKDEDGLVPKISVSGAEIKCAGRSDVLSSTALFRDLRTILDFLATRLPPTISVPLSLSLIPALTTRMEEAWLEPAIPLTMSETALFQEILGNVAELADRIDTLGWRGSEGLREWIQNAPRAWLTKRREAVLGEVRNLVFVGLRERQVVERVETRIVRREDSGAMGGRGGGDGAEEDWDTAWDAPDEDSESASTRPEPKVDDEDEASAWEVDDVRSETKDRDGEGAEDDAWGWGDGDEAAGAPSKPPSPVATRKSQLPPTTVNGDKPAEQEMTLRETFTVTAIPDGLLSILQTIISDAQTLAGPEFASSPIAPAATALYTLPTLALAIYRATAPTAYAKLDVGNILIYNDASRLADRLRSWQNDQTPSSKLRLDNDVAALEAFAKRAYASDMDSQRTILRDLLDGAQGFVNCTVQPFRAECEGAVDAAVDRLSDVHALWTGILSQGALLQSLGSLLSTLTAKMVTEIEELGDISEAESQQLKLLCDKVSATRSLFTSVSEQGQDQDLTFIYCPTWLKFQYLAEILESSLADIKWMWKEGELALEFEAEEVVELVQALFAESELRRQAVREIRRGR